MQQALRPYATAGVALVGASMIAVTPLAVPPPTLRRCGRCNWSTRGRTSSPTRRPTWTASSAMPDSSDITQLFNELLTNPFGVIESV